MSAHRRDFLNLVAGSVVAAVAAPAVHAQTTDRNKIRAVAFDGFPIIDPRPVFAKVEEMFPGKGAELSNAWRTRQFEYTWLRTLSGHYADFWHGHEEALVFAAKALQIDLSADAARSIDADLSRAEGVAGRGAGLEANEGRRHPHGVPVELYRCDA